MFISPIKEPVRNLGFERMLKYLMVLTGLGVLFAWGIGQRGHSQGRSHVYHLVVLHTNDTHGHPVKFSYRQGRNIGGLPARATLVKRIRKENRNVLVLDAGDLNTGRPESNLFKAKPDILGYNHIGYEAMVLGNHEFDNSVDVLREQMEWAHFPFLSANVRTRNREYLAQPYIIKNFDGFKVAVFGLTTKETEITGHPKYIKGLIFEDEIDVAKKLVPKLKEEADMVIALVHMGIFESSQKGSKRLASEIGGIDLIVDGHTHTRMDSPILIKNSVSDHKTLIVQAWQWGLVVGRIDLWMENKRIKDFKFKTIPINLQAAGKKSNVARFYPSLGDRIGEDEALLNLLRPYVDQVKSALSEIIGYAKGTFSMDHVRDRETALGDIIADSMLWYTERLGVDFAIQNGGGIRADLPRGQITKRLIHEILPFENSVVVLTMKGSDVQYLFDYIATLSGGKGAFPQVSEGLSFTINRAEGICENILINGKPFDQKSTYKIATNSYLAHGGDGYKMLLNAVDKYDYPMFQRDVFIEYIQFLGGRIKPKMMGRITIIPEKAYLSLKQAAGSSSIPSPVWKQKTTDITFSWNGPEYG